MCDVVSIGPRCRVRAVVFGRVPVPVARACELVAFGVEPLRTGCVYSNAATSPRRNHCKGCAEQNWMRLRGAPRNWLRLHKRNQFPHTQPLQRLRRAELDAAAQTQPLPTGQRLHKRNHFPRASGYTNATTSHGPAAAQTQPVPTGQRLHKRNQFPNARQLTRFEIGSRMKYRTNTTATIHSSGRIVRIRPAATAITTQLMKPMPMPLAIE